MSKGIERFAKVSAFVVLGLLGACSGAQDGSESTSDEISVTPGGGGGVKVQHVCDQATKPGFAHCHAVRRTDIKPQLELGPDATPSGFGPNDLRSAYNLPSSGGNGKIVAIVDAQDYPQAEADLGVYRSTYGLPPCTTANGCFKKVNQNGQSSNYPTADSGWAGEMALDLDMVSAACPDCKIILVEANSADMADLGAAVNTAASLGAVAISNSYGGSEDNTNTQSDSQFFSHPGISIFASSGDSGFGVEYPAASANVIAVGGTSLSKSGNSRGWTETAWNGAGAGCSQFTPAIGAQSGTNTGCAKRAVADVSAIADPNTGVAVYDSFADQGSPAGWNVYGGTSVASPLVAAIFAVTGNAGVGNDFPYAHKSDFYDVTSGNDGTCTGAKQLCTAGAGWDGPTGLGTPNGGALENGGTTDGGTDSGSDSGSDGGTTDSGSDGGHDIGGGGTCSHNMCSSGKKLKNGCNSCVSEICAQDSYCCSTKWDSICVGEVGSICGDTCN